jgi:transcriptional regulator with XRE-family HTH domain
MHYILYMSIDSRKILHYLLFSEREMEIAMQNPTKADIGLINGETLKTMRKRRGWSQRQLADKCKCAHEHISRLERGASSAPRPRLREALVKALGVEWEKLTLPIPDDERNTSNGPLDMIQLNVRIDQKVRNAFSLMRLRYGVQPAELVELAPLLFIILAERSLDWRRRNVDAIDKAMEEISELAPHYQTELNRGIFYFEDAEISERDSIAARDVFGRELEFQNGEPGNPFMSYVDQLATNLIKNGLISYIYAEYPGEQDYLFCADEDLRSASGLNGEHKHDDEVIMFIRLGLMNLEEIIDQRKHLSEDEYFIWIERQYMVQMSEKKSWVLDQF